ncbi:G-protein coupled receptor dmsr-1 [Patella vulgata]|uniref:G-protein coupled receptor dmsr-1 n=1 Tax=Patella vulgata TaxID=6465 RepID=UPI00217FE143|nr:G-protein coupled receptor dmsr-1 [Patella vulgata]XP_055955855.1 G-protein coupled receptor dmsr-1 [Patella vulgata]
MDYSTDNITLTTMDTLLNISGTNVPSEQQQECKLGYIPGVASQATVDRLKHFAIEYTVIHGYISAIVCTFGIMANIANIIVLTRKNMISSTNTILMWLAVADLFTMMSYLSFAFCFYIFREPNLEKFLTRSFARIVLLLFHASFSMVCHTVAIWLTIALAIFRYIYICLPTKGAIYCSLRRAKQTILVVYVLTVILCVPNYISNRYYTKTTVVNSSQLANSTNETNVLVTETVYLPGSMEGSDMAVAIFTLNSWIQAILFKLIPCAMLTTLTILLIHAMHKAYRKRMRLKSQGRKAESEKHGEHNRTTGMLLAVVVLFTLTELPQGILTLMNIFKQHQCFRQYVYDALGDLVDTMALMNNSINFVLYCSMSKQFRDTFMGIFCKCFNKNPQGFLKMMPVTAATAANGHGGVGESKRMNTV